MSPALETRGLGKRFGALVAAADINFRLEAGARHALIGPNGAGKTTLVNMLTGALAPSSGSIFLGDREVTRASQASRVKQGLARTYQINALFRNLTVLDNVALGVAERRGIAHRMWRAASSYDDIREECRALLALLGLADDAANPVLDLPYGKQRLVEIAIALGLKPAVLLLDEPAAGVPAVESGRIFDALDRLPPAIAVLIIEHDMNLVFRFARRISVLVQGAILVEGTPGEIAAASRVREVYLGDTLLPERFRQYP